MTSEQVAEHPIDLQYQAYQCFLDEEYSQAIQLYEQAIELAPEDTFNYWYLGVALILKEQEAEAQYGWSMLFAEGDPDQEAAWIQELVQVLQTEAERREYLREFGTAWALRRHIQEIQPQNLNNLLRIIQLAEHPEAELDQQAAIVDAIALLNTASSSEINSLLLLEAVSEALEFSPHWEEAIDLLQAALPYADNESLWVDAIGALANRVCHAYHRAIPACRIAEVMVERFPDYLALLGLLSAFYQKASRYEDGIKAAQTYIELAPSLPTRVFGSYLLLRGLMSAGGFWEEVQQALDNHKQLLREFMQVAPESLDTTTATCMFNSTFFLPYLIDNIEHNRSYHNQVSKLCQQSIQYHAQAEISCFAARHHSLRASGQPKKVLKIGYLSSYLRQHSVGWLARWLFQHHDPEQFQIYAYLINMPEADVFTQHWFVNHTVETRFLGINGSEIAQTIFQDEIDILVDLDSLTLDTTCEVMSLKAAPIQVTWLGWDASGIPTIDYYIADSYVLPDNAQEHYSETIWRLPQTYIAVDGFEIGIPDLRRDTLEIPTDAVIYLSAQQGLKRNPTTARLQLQILKQVPNSYFLVKSVADQVAVKQAFLQVAAEEGIAADRLRFLPTTASEATHRANLGIADVVLDTYPYNGATTTLETLWMGIPIVTRVGEHFSSRNSYTMMMNAGVTEGIAWTDEEYIEWGVRLGQDQALRQDIAYRLRASRQTAPLWNGKQFARDMEQAYREMWQRYVT